ncbi:hypothetical protein ES705_23369 [subsurface metagenome]
MPSRFDHASGKGIYGEQEIFMPTWTMGHVVSIGVSGIGEIFSSGSNLSTGHFLISVIII